MAHRVARVLAGLGVMSAMACSRVPAYERGRLAHPTMQAGHRSSAAQAHVYAIQEGARGGSVGSGSGCGCN